MDLTPKVPSVMQKMSEGKRHRLASDIALHGAMLLFEGVCETLVILTPGACGRVVRAALHDTISAGPGVQPCQPCKCPMARSFVQAWYLSHICPYRCPEDPEDTQGVQK